MKRIVVDHDLCEANAVCVMVAPDVFQVDEDDKLHLLVEQPPAESLEKVETRFAVARAVPCRSPTIEGAERS
jgi:ferredoxin